MLKNSGGRNFEKNLVIFSFTIIPVLLILTFSYYPLLKMFQYSLHDWNGYSVNPKFVGLENYKTVFWKGILFFPYFYKGGGTFDTVLKAIGLGDQIHLWLGDRSINNISLAFTSIWRYTGFNFLVFLGAIQSINPEVYEAAEIDGANRWDEFRYIIMPSIRNIIFLNIILGVSGSLSVFDIPYIMTGGSNGTTTFVIQTIDTAFKYNKVGLASAMAIILLIIVIVVSLVQRLATQERKK